MEDRDDLLENSKLIFDHIQSNPGIHLREISRQLAIHSSTLRYHLDLLEKKGLIISKKEKNIKIFFVADRLSSRDKDITQLLQQKRFRDIILLIIISDELTHTDICSQLSIKPPTLSKYINILEKRGVIGHKRTGREKRYHVNDEKKVMELLLAYKRSFWDSFVENVLEIYFER